MQIVKYYRLLQRYTYGIYSLKILFHLGIMQPVPDTRHQQSQRRLITFVLIQIKTAKKPP